jgi:hypothetical protein
MNLTYLALIIFCGRAMFGTLSEAILFGNPFAGTNFAAE